jgi:hypothetical protein
MKININAFGSHPDSEENRGCIKDVDFLGQIDELLAGNPTDEQLEEVRKTLFGTNKAWVPRLLLDDLTNSPIVPPTPPIPGPVGPEPWPTRVSPGIPGAPGYVDPTEFDHYRIEFDIENDDQEISLFYKYSGQFAWVPSRVVIDDNDVDLMESYELSSGSHILEIYDDPESPEYSTFSVSWLSSDFAHVIRKLYIPDYITSILNNTDYICFTNLTELHIPHSVTSIGSYAFASSSNLSQLYISTSGGALEIENDSFSNCGLTSVYIPDRVTKIGDCAFMGCDELYEVRIPNITYFGQNAFWHCDNLGKVYFDDNCTYIGYMLCSQCNLRYIYIPENVVNIDYHAFSENINTQYIFAKCITPPNLGSEVFMDTDNCPIYVPDESVEAYKIEWSAYADRIHSIYDYTGPSNVDEI